MHKANYKIWIYFAENWRSGEENRAIYFLMMEVEHLIERNPAFASSILSISWLIKYRSPIEWIFNDWRRSGDLRPSFEAIRDCLYDCLERWRKCWADFRALWRPSSPLEITQGGDTLRALWVTSVALIYFNVFIKGKLWVGGSVGTIIEQFQSTFNFRNGSFA